MATPRESLDSFQAPEDTQELTVRLRPLRPRLVPPRTGGTRPGGHLRTILFRYLAAAVVLLAIVLLIDPHDPERAAPDTRPWLYQRDTVNVEGRGILNVWSRAAIRTTAWMARGAIERLRDVNRLNLLDLMIGRPTASKVGGWREANNLALERSTKLAMLLLVAFGVLARVKGRAWIIMILILLSLTLLLTKPQTVVRTAGDLGTRVPDAMVALYGHIDSAHSLDGARPAEETQRALAADYWQAFVASPLSRMQTGSPVLSGAEPERRGGLLRSLRDGVTSVNDWAVGRHGWERMFISTSALAYVVPFSVAVAALAMVATAAQALLFVLCLAGLVVVPIGVDRRYRPMCFKYWLLPGLATVAVLAVSTFAALLVMRLGQAVHVTDEYIGLLLAGSLWPIAALVALRVVARRRRAAASSNGGTAA